ncbi:MAG: DUF4258 domain-containing protein [Deltaproteobacteria bacterium]|nr:DUF4258 domain-containing protein [Deltaproteobacteria bacterium]MCL5277830.1 DUF4258 domain-containing protein [Deltaproteobacteria bacterium]
MKDTEDFIALCAAKEKLLWTYHINMRLKTRDINTEDVIHALKDCKVIEEYPQNAPLPSCLVLGKDKQNKVIHVVVAVDKDEENLRIITSYRPTLEYWEKDLKTRRR